MVEDEVPDADYSKGIPIAKVTGAPYRSQHSPGDIIRINPTPTTKLGLFGPSGSGKTVFGKAFVSRLAETGRVIYNGGDVKNDFKSMDKYGGVSQELQQKMGLMDNEQPREIRTQVVSPKPVLDAWGKNPSYVDPFTFGFQDISQQDFKFLIGEGDLTSSQEAVVTRILGDIDLDHTGFDQLEDQVEEKAENAMVETSLNSQLLSLRNDAILSNQFRTDPLQYLSQGVSVSLGLRGYANFSNGGMYKVQFYAANLFKNLMSAAMDGEIGHPLCGLWAEFHRLAPANQPSLLKQQLEEFFNMRQRQMDMPIVLDSQAPSQIPNPNSSSQYNFLGKLSTVFLGCDRNGRPLGEQEWKTVLKSMNLLTRSNKSDWRRRVKDLERFEFLYLTPDAEPKTCPKVKSLAPLVSHPG